MQIIDLFLLLVVLFLQQFFIAWHLHSSKDFVQLVAGLLYVIGFPSVIILMKVNFTILTIFYKGTKRRVYNILYISLKLAYSVDIHLLTERDYSLVQAQLASQENQQGSLHSP